MPPFHANGREPDAAFDTEEFLYRRYHRDHFKEGRLLPFAIQFDKPPSFNRSKYSAPEDVLHPDCCGGLALEGFGVLQCQVEAIPAPIPVAGDNRVYLFAVKHVPCETCYAHSELWCMRDGGDGKYEKPPKSVREKLRVRIAQSLQVCIQAPE